MNIKKFAAIAAAAVMAAAPMGTACPFSPAITAEAFEEYTTKDGFVICNTGSGERFIGGYRGTAKTVTLPKDASVVGNYAFDGDCGVENVVIPANYTLISYDAFEYCKSLKTVTFEKGSKLAALDENAFDHCVNLQKIDLSPCKELKTVGWGAFGGCSSLKTADLSGCTKLTEIEGAAFDGCFELRTVLLPEGLQNIGELAFANCAKLEALTVPPKAKVGEHFAGYMYGCEESIYDGYGDDHEFKAVKADGKRSIYTYYSIEAHSTVQEQVIKQKAMTLYVTKGSEGERYAKANGIAYKYGTAPAVTEAAAPKELKASSGNGWVKLTWKKASGAAKYTVYVYNEKTKKYEKYKTVTDTSCKVTGLGAGKQYKFKVYSYGKNGDKGGSAAVTAKTQ